LRQNPSSYWKKQPVNTRQPMIFSDFFVFRAIRLIKRNFPPFILRAITLQLPVSFLLSLLEIFGLLILLPIIQILLNPELISRNKMLKTLYTFSGVHNEVEFVMILLGVVIVFFFFKTALVYWASRRQTELTYTIGSRLATLKFQEHLLQPYSYHVKASTGDIQRKIVELPFNFVSGIFFPLLLFINEIIVTVIILASIVWFNPLLVICLIFFITPFFLAYSRIYKKRLKQFSEDRNTGQAVMFNKSKQAIEGFREILLFQRLDFFVSAFKLSVMRYSDAVSHLVLLNSFYPRVVELLAVFCIFAIFLIGVLLGLDMRVLASFLATFALAAYRLIPSMNKMLLCYNNIKSHDFVFDVNAPEPVSQSDVTIEKPAEDVSPMDFRDCIGIENMSFGFQKHKNVLQGIDLQIYRGEVVGIVGRSGSGKTTLINILLGLFPPDQGRILIDDKELTKGTMKNWHKTVSLVPQNPILIEGTLMENIVFGIPTEQVDMRRLNEAIERSSLTEFVDGLSHGLQSRIGDGALNISGGQKQRIAIARALYHNGKVLIFDEATSSLDKETERDITESIRKLSDQHYTIIIITHQLEILKYCTRIYRLEKGRLSQPAGVHPSLT
jgi:ATP-binding cassette, subfamily B, bacterial PglK